MRMTIHSVRSPAPDNFGMTEWTGDLNVRNASFRILSHLPADPSLTEKKEDYS